MMQTPEGQLRMMLDREGQLRMMQTPEGQLRMMLDREGQLHYDADTRMEQCSCI